MNDKTANIYYNKYTCIPYMKYTIYYESYTTSSITHHAQNEENTAPPFTRILHIYYIYIAEATNKSIHPVFTFKTTSPKQQQTNQQKSVELTYLYFVNHHSNAIHLHEKTKYKYIWVQEVVHVFFIGP